MNFSSEILRYRIFDFAPGSYFFAATAHLLLVDTGIARSRFGHKIQRSFQYAKYHTIGDGYCHRSIFFQL
jgi:hypothetical protein